MEPFIATILLWAPNFEPQGWALCQGQLISISTNTALFSLLGTTYGGDGVTTFALPDFRGRVPVGVGQGPGLSNYIQGMSSGTEQTTLAVANMPAHNHRASTSDLSVSIPAVNGNPTTSVPSSTVSPAIVQDSRTNPLKAYSDGAANASLRSGTVTGEVAVGVTGGSQPFNNMQPYLVVNYIIALEGIFPSRN